MARKRTVETHVFKRGQKTHLDQIYFIQALAGGDWWKAADPGDPKGDGGESVTITRSIKITIIAESP